MCETKVSLWKQNEVTSCPSSGHLNTALSWEGRAMEGGIFRRGEKKFLDEENRGKRCGVQGTKRDLVEKNRKVGMSRDQESGCEC